MSTLTANSLPFEIRRYIKRNGYDDLCSICKFAIIYECCNKCGDAVCNRNNCCETFPHYYNTLFTICNKCISKIDKNLHTLIENYTN